MSFDPHAIWALTWGALNKNTSLFAYVAGQQGGTNQPAAWPSTSLHWFFFYQNLKTIFFCHTTRQNPWEGLGAGEGDDRGWDGWMASLTRWTWVSVNSGSWWWTGRPGVLRFMGSRRVRHDWATELNKACKVLVSQPGIKSGPQAVKVLSLNHWTAREFSTLIFKGCLGKKQHTNPKLLLTYRKSLPTPYDCA